MSHTEFNQLLSTIAALPPEQMRQLFHELESKLAGEATRPATANLNAEAAEETAFDVASRAGLIGCIKGASRSPTDLSTNPKHMEGFGRG
jgi:hypothetical protein